MSVYLPVLLLVVVAVALAVIILILAQLLTRFVVRPRASRAKMSPYESGVNPIGNARLRFSIKFYLVAMIFIIFDVEVIFFYTTIFWEMIVFTAMLVLGYIYVWRKGGLDWD
jgi:NADH-quinone oxidoreductase subunit A